MGLNPNDQAIVPLLRPGYSLYGVNSVVPVLGAAEVDLAAGDFHQLIMPDTDVVLTFANPRIGTYRLIVAHHANAHLLTFPLVFFEYDAAPSARVYSLDGGAQRRTEFTLVYDGAAWSVKTTNFASPWRLLLSNEPTTPAVPPGANVVYGYQEAGLNEVARVDFGARGIPMRDSYVLGVNLTGDTLAAGTVVYLSGTEVGHPRVSKALALGTTTSRVLGVVDVTTADTQSCRVWRTGYVYNVATNAWAPGTQLYLSATTAGELTDVAPDLAVPVAVVMVSHATAGVLLVLVGSTASGAAAGGGSTGINYVPNGDAETGTAGWVLYDDRAEITAAGATTTAATNRVNFVAHGLLDGTAVFLTGVTGFLDFYYVVNATADDFQLAYPVTGALADITVDDTGVGIHRVSPTDGVGGTPTATWDNLETAAPLRGAKSFRFGKGSANLSGQGVAYDFIIDHQDQGTVLAISFDCRLTVGSVFTPGDFVVWVYDVTNARLIKPENFDLLSPSATAGTFICRFHTAPDSRNYRLLLHNLNASAVGYTLVMDSVRVGPQETHVINPVLDWQPYVYPGLTSPDGVFTHLQMASGTCRWARVGDTVTLEFTGVMNGSSDNTHNYIVFQPPPFLPLDPSIPGGQIVGSARTGRTTSELPIVMIARPDLNGFLFAPVNNALSDPLPGQYADQSSWPGAAGAIISVSVTYKVLGWGSNVQVSEVDSQREVSVHIEGIPAIPYVADTPMLWTLPNVVRDTQGAFDPLTGEFVVPTDGLYDFKILLQTNAVAGASLYISVNGETSNTWVQLNTLAVSYGSGFYSGSAQKYLTRGQVVTLRENAGFTTGGGAANQCRVSISRVMVPQSMFLDGVTSSKGVLTTKGYGYPSPKIITDPGSNIFVFDCLNGDVQKMTMSDVNCSLSLINPRIGAFSLVVTSHATNNRNLNFPSVNFVGIAGLSTPSIVMSAGHKTIFNLFYDGSEWFVSFAGF